MEPETEMVSVVVIIGVTDLPAVAVGYVRDVVSVMVCVPEADSDIVELDEPVGPETETLRVPDIVTLIDSASLSVIWSVRDIVSEVVPPERDCVAVSSAVNDTVGDAPSVAVIEPDSDAVELTFAP